MNTTDLNNQKPIRSDRLSGGPPSECLQHFIRENPNYVFPTPDEGDFDPRRLPPQHSGVVENRLVEPEVKRNKRKSKDKE